MSVAKCMLKLAMASKLCDALISKEILVLTSLIDENEGIRVSDIHAALGGNKSWVSNLCSRLGDAGLAFSTKEGREVFYNLTKRGKDVAEKAFGLLESLVKAEKIPYILSDNTFLLNTPFSEKIEEIRKSTKLIHPIHTHKGAILLNQAENYLLFIGKDLKKRLFVFELSLKEIEKIEEGFDDYYKRRYAPRPKPLYVDYYDVLEQTPKKIYLFINFHIIRRTTQNSEWLKLINNALLQIQEDDEKSKSLESERDVVPMIEGHR